MAYGEGFLIFDGTDETDYAYTNYSIGDGSRTTYFDAIKLTGVFGDTSADLFTAKVNEGVYANQDDEDVYGLYITNKTLKDYTLEVYGLQRERRSKEGDEIPIQNSTTAVGARSTGKVIENLTYAVELTKEFGKVNKADVAGIPPILGISEDMDRDAWGGLASLTFAMPQVPTQPSLKVGAYYTSGDKNGTDDKYEGWDCFYSEFPKYGYGDLLSTISKNAIKTGSGDEGFWSNHTIYEVDLKTTPIPKMTTSLGFLYLMANTTPTSSTSKVRGRCPQAKLEYQFTQAVSGHLLGQYFLPGDYYKDATAATAAYTGGNIMGTDKAFFGRAEMMIKF